MTDSVSRALFSNDGGHDGTTPRPDANRIESTDRKKRGRRREESEKENCGPCRHREFRQDFLMVLKNGSSSEGNLGRRDWIRTNDPHHVKVVL